MYTVDESLRAWAYSFTDDKTCTCGVDKAMPKEPNREDMHSEWCDKYKKPKWLEEREKEDNEKRTNAI